MLTYIRLLSINSFWCSIASPTANVSQHCPTFLPTLGTPDRYRVLSPTRLSLYPGSVGNEPFMHLGLLSTNSSDHCTHAHMA